jgi:hypothetical protein
LIEWSVPGSETRFYELYGHKTDPQQNANNANIPTQKETLGELVQQLRAESLRANAASPSR